MSETDPVAKTHSGGCHCGRVRYEVDAVISEVIACNCSICAKRGSLLTAVEAGSFRSLAGDAALTEYRFASHTIRHLFCATCGILPYARSDDTVMVNVRSLDDFDPSALVEIPFDGRSV